MLTRVNDSHLASGELVLAHHQAQGCERRRVILENHAIMHPEHAAASHVPPAHGAILAGHVEGFAGVL